MAPSIRRGRWLAVASAGLLAVTACTGVASPPPAATSTATPIATPSEAPTAAPTAEPTDAPTAEPTEPITPEPPTEPPTPSPAAVEYPLELTDAVGETHVFEGPPEKDGCWWFGCIENMADLGLAPYAAGSDGNPTDSVMFFPAGPPTVHVSDTFSVEEWAAADVEIFISDSYGIGGEQQEAFEQVAPVFHLHTPFPEDGDTDALRGVDTYLENVRLMGQVTGQPAAADAAIARFEAFVAALQARAPAGAAETEISPLWSSNEGAYFVMADSEPFCDALATYSLGRCIDATGQLNAEAYLEIDPEWIAYIVFGEDSWEKRTPDPVWGELSAVSSGQIYDASPGGPSRIFCCSLRGLTHALQEYAHHVWGEAGGVPDPGPVADFDPARSGIFEES